MSAAPVPNSTSAHDHLPRIGRVIKVRLEHTGHAADESRSDIVIWLCSVVFLVGVTAVLNFGQVDNLTARVRLFGGASGPLLDSLLTPSRLVALTVAVALAASLVAARRAVASLRWPYLQAVTMAATFGWTVSLGIVRGYPAMDTTAATHVGRQFIQTLQSITGRSPDVALVVIAFLAALATAFVNAGVQSLCGSAQARRFGVVIALSPLAAWYAEGSVVFTLVLVSATLGLAAMASERGRGLGWSTSLGVVAGLLLACAALAEFEGAAAGIGVLCIFFLRRRSLMILVAAIGLTIGLISALAAGWSWTHELASASRLSQQSLGSYVALIIAVVILIIATAGPVIITSGRKLRCTPAWPIMLTGGAGLIFVFAARTFTGSIIGAVAPWSVLLIVACVAPKSQGGTPHGPPVGVASLSALAVIAWTALMCS